jgi:hypothetical protein
MEFKHFSHAYSACLILKDVCFYNKKVWNLFYQFSPVPPGVGGVGGGDSLIYACLNIKTHMPKQGPTLLPMSQLKVRIMEAKFYLPKIPVR